MERSEWLRKMRARSEAMYNRFAPVYWVKFGVLAGAVHRQYIEKFLGQMRAKSTLLDAGCGAGLYDEMLLKPGHNGLGIDQSSGMLARVREMFPEERFPRLRYLKMGLQEMDFKAEFDGAICMDAMVLLYPMLFLSGAFFSVELLPKAIQKISAFMPLTYVVNLLRGLWAGQPWGNHLLDVGVLVGMLLVGIIVSVKTFRWE